MSPKPKAKQVSSILDLLPRSGEVAYNALPKFIRAQIDEFRRSGGHTMSADDFAAVTALTEQIRALGIEQRVLGSKISDVHKAQSELGGTILKRLDEMQKEQYEQRLLVVGVEKRVDAHDVVIGVHAKKHVETAEQLGAHAKKHVELATEITGVHQRLVVVEQLITTKRPTRRKKAKTK